MEANWGVKESERILWILGVQYLRIAVAQICESVGFERFNESALDSFADIAIKYLFDLGKTGTSYANLAGRSECIRHSSCIGGSVEYVESAEEIPFAQPVPHFPVVKVPRMIPNFEETGNGMEKLLLYKRAAVCLVFRPGKKVLGDSLDLRLWNKSSARTAKWFRRDEDKDDKKRRAELILRQSMENQQELTQL
nr:transcription initiation factor TFIID subunit 8 [Ipomoea batatas]GME17320.1 transcription initiation factor TFIID subunit 8 [Ipomoea batatas]